MLGRVAGDHDAGAHHVVEPERARPAARITGSGATGHELAVTPGRGEDLGRVQGVDHVGVAGEEPEVVAIVVDRAEGAQRFVGRERVAGHLRREDVGDHGVGVDGHRPRQSPVMAEASSAKRVNTSAYSVTMFNTTCPAFSGRFI